LSLAQIQVFGFDVRDMLAIKNSQPTSEIKEGDCLRGPEIQKFAGVENIDLYYTFECGVAYDLKGQNLQQLSCGLDGVTGNWARETKEHRMPGVFFPAAVPCMSSVTSLDYMNSKFTDIPENEVCDLDKVQKFSERTETMRTKKFAVGQGEAYLPQPISTKVVEYQNTAEGASLVTSCREAVFEAEYRGWGTFQLKWRKSDCLTNKQTECFIAKLSQSKNEEGHDCALVKKLTPCDSRLHVDPVSSRLEISF
jgi:hypothetical protein